MKTNVVHQLKDLCSDKFKIVQLRCHKSNSPYLCLKGSYVSLTMTKAPRHRKAENPSCWRS